MFDKVKVWPEVVLPTLMEPKLWVRGLHDKLGKVPVTVRPLGVVETVPPTVQVLFKVAVLEPVAEGVAVKITVQLLPLDRLLVPQLSVVIEKSAELAPPNVGAEQPVADEVPVFDKVKV